MPSNPFGGIGSGGDAKQIAEQTRALRSYEQARKRLISSMKGEERAVAGLSAAHAAAMQSRSRDSNAYERELTRTAGLLGAQGAALKNLDSTRERYHKEEMDRSQSLLQRYEGLKQALRELQEDTKDTTTIVGGIFQPLREGIDNMLKFGDLPKVTKPIRDAAISFDDVSGSIKRGAGATVDLGRAMVDVARPVFQYRAAIEELNVGFSALNLKYADSEEGAKKLAHQFIQLGKIDLSMPGAVEGVLGVTDALKGLEAQGVSAETTLGLLVERSRKSGRSFQDTAQDIEVVAAQADLLRESFSDTDKMLEGFTFTVRDDFVRAIADATRNLDSQIISVENVGAAYAYAAKKAHDYGLSAEHSEKVASAFGKVVFGEREDAFAMLSGGRLRRKMEKALSEFDVAYNDATAEMKVTMEEAVANSLGMEVTDDNRAAIQESIMAMGEGLGDVDIRNMLSGTTAGIETDLESIMKDVGLGQIKDISVLQRMLKQNFGLDLNTQDSRKFARLMQEGRGSEVASEIQTRVDDAESRVNEGKALTSSALSAVLTFKDPIQQLFNIKDFLKSIMLNVSNVVKLLGNLPFVGDNITELYDDLTGETVEKAYGGTASIDAALAASDESQSQRAAELGEAMVALTKATTDGERTESKSRVDQIAASIREDNAKREELTHLREEQSRISAIARGDLLPNGEKPSATAPSEGLTRELASGVSEWVSEIFNGAPERAESGRTAGIAMARRTPDTARPDARTAYDRAQSRPAGSQPGEMEAAGAGEVTVDASGESVMTVRMRIKNMGEVIAHHSSNEARTLDQFGLGG